MIIYSGLAKTRWDADAQVWFSLQPFDETGPERGCSQSGPGEMDTEQIDWLVFENYIDEEE